MSFIFLAVLCFSAGAATEPDGPPHKNDEPLTAAQILSRTNETYRNCKSYRDTGSVTSVFKSKNHHDFTEGNEFKTAFIRPNPFRFEYKDNPSGVLAGLGFLASMMGKPDRMIIHADNSGVKSWWGIQPGIRHESSLPMAIAGATGVSSRASYNIPSLLFGGFLLGACITVVDEQKLLDDGMLDGVACYRISGKSGNRLTTFWIDKKKFLIMRLDDPDTLNDGTTVEAITLYKPEINVDIDPKELEFGAPAK